MWLALTGAPVVPDQLRAEWASWAIELEDLADKVAKGAAKMLMRDRRELEAVTAERDELRGQLDARDAFGVPAVGAGGGYSPLKRELNRRLLAARGVNIPHSNGVSHVDGSEGE